MPVTCQHVRADGEPCRANANASGYCFFHDPSKADERAAARRAGGRERSKRLAVLPSDAPDVELRNVGDVVALLGTTINQVRRGELDSKASNAVGYLASVLLRALEGSDLAKEVSDLNRRLTEFERGNRNAQDGGNQDRS